VKEKKTFYCEVAYIIGIIILAFGTALMEKADFGMSMIVAPAYLLHLKISPHLPFFSFGVAEYVFQAFLLVLLSLVLRKVKKIFSIYQINPTKNFSLMPIIVTIHTVKKKNMSVFLLY